MRYIRIILIGLWIAFMLICIIGLINSLFVSEHIRKEIDVTTRENNAIIKEIRSTLNK